MVTVRRVGARGVVVRYCSTLPHICDTRDAQKIQLSRVAQKNIILSRKCPTSLCRWDGLTTFLGRAMSTITPKQCYFRAVMELDQIPYEFFCSRLQIILSRKFPISVCRWDVLTSNNFLGPSYVNKNIQFLLF